MTKPFLFEIGVEEMPAHVVTPSRQQLQERIGDFLDEQRLSYGTITSYSTPRRLAVLVNDLADKQTDIEEEFRGPAKKIAQDADGNWTRAATGFAQGKGMKPDDIFFKEIKGTEYAFINQSIKGKPAKEVLSGIEAIIPKMTFPTRMHWADYNLEFIRPIHWLVALLDEEIVPMHILDIESGRRTQGHRFLGEAVDIKKATDYEQDLADQFVIVDGEKRKNVIKDQITAIGDEKNWQIHVDPSLLEEVTNLVEFPTAFSGSFDKKYLNIPEEVLITSMADNQRYFYARDDQKKLLPNFISVRNGDKVHIENVVKGNEKVLTARLEDADFFFAEDQKQTIQDDVEKLKKVSFHDQIGSMYEKMQRVQVISQLLGNLYHLTDQEMVELNRASEIYKFDLVTGMVGEFPELQGVMGEKYAELMGEDHVAAQAIREHYMPTSSEGALPESKVGTVLSIADKLDSIMSFFAVDMIPNGSNDPYALRRQAYGIVRMVEAHQLHFNVDQIEALVNDELLKNDRTFGLNFTNHYAEVTSFILDRMRQWLSTDDFRYDIVDTVLATNQPDLINIFDSAKVLTEASESENFKPTIEALTRVLKIAKKADFSDIAVDPKLFENECEKSLYEAVNKIADQLENDSIESLYDQLRGLTGNINEYFDQTMVMAKDEKLKHNRLSQMVILSNIIEIIGDLNQLVIK